VIFALKKMKQILTVLFDFTNNLQLLILNILTPSWSKENAMKKRKISKVLLRCFRSQFNLIHRLHKLILG